MAAQRKQHVTTAEVAHRRQQVAHLWLCGIPTARIARQLKTPETTIRRDITAVRDELRTAHAADLEHDRARSLAVLRLVQSEAWQLFAKVKETNPNKVGALNTILNAEQMAIKIQGTQAQPDVQVSQTVNVLAAPEWTAIRSAILAALATQPEARTAVADAILLLEAPHDEQRPGA